MAKDKKEKDPQNKVSEKERKAKATETKSGQKQSGKLKYIIAIIIIFAIIVAAIFSGVFSNSGTSFSVFENNFNSAPRVGIFVTDYNGTVFASTIDCATEIITQLTANRQYHRNSSTIDFNIVNQTSCIRAEGLLGTGGTNTITTSLQNCLNDSSLEPTIYINYSSTNKTTIEPKALYISGTPLFLKECGVASEIS